MVSKKYAEVNKKRCVSCGTCVKECPLQIIHIYRGSYAVIDPERCVGCSKCASACPADCIEIIERSPSR